MGEIGAPWCMNAEMMNHRLFPIEKSFLSTSTRLLLLASASCVRACVHVSTVYRSSLYQYVNELVHELFEILHAHRYITQIRVKSIVRRTARLEHLRSVCDDFLLRRARVHVAAAQQRAAGRRVLTQVDVRLARLSAQSVHTPFLPATSSGVSRDSLRSGQAKRTRGRCRRRPHATRPVRSDSPTRRQQCS